jgi:hypothetical protein
MSFGEVTGLCQGTSSLGVSRSVSEIAVVLTVPKSILKRGQNGEGQPVACSVQNMVCGSESMPCSVITFARSFTYIVFVPL